VAAQERREWAFQAVRSELATLRGKRVAILGFGHIGRRIAALAAACGARVTAIARSKRIEAGIAVEPLAALRAVVAGADALVIAAPLTAETEGLVGRDVLAAMPSGSLLINVSRGPIVVADDLLAALDSGALAAAALDVTDPEPLPPEHPLWTRHNLVITPHVAGIGGGALMRAELEELVVDNVRRFVTGRPLCHVVRSPGEPTADP
jgi:phosphoglycerate dehydrogenase-like enzyme